MRTGLTVGCILLLWDIATCPAADPPQTSSDAKPFRSAVPDILREASEITRKQVDHQRYWSDGTLLHIAEVQVRARDFDGALKSIRGSRYGYGRNSALVDLAKALAREGERERAFEILRLLDADHGWKQDYLDDSVQLPWIEHLIASGDLDRAQGAVKQLKSEWYRPEALRQLAVACAKSGDAARSAEHFTRAVDGAAYLPDEFNRARALWEIANAQLTVGAADAAKATVHRLLGTNEPKDAWARVAALRESAMLAAKANDQQTARQLFRRAIEAQPAVNALNKSGALQMISVGQAEVGYLDDARNTASMIKHSASDFTEDGKREEALLAIAVAQLRANDTEGATRTALAVKHFIQYRDDALHKIVDHQIAKRDLKAALATAEKVDDPSRRATAILKVATAHAKSGDRKTAADVAARIDLTSRDSLLPTVGKECFDYRLPRTWGVCYDAGVAFTMASHHMSIQRTAELAAAAMTLSQALGQKPAESYAILFNDITTEEVTHALARAHAASGDASEALAWAKQIGSDGKVASNDAHHAGWAVQRRIHALVGVAEGILDR